jgi:hypothetical protein
MHRGDTLGGVGDGPLHLVGAALNILLGDGPPVIGGMVAQSVNLGIDSVQVINNGQSYTIATYSTPVVVNVMANQGSPSSIGIGSVWSQSYTGVSFTIDQASSNLVDTNGNVHPLYFRGSASQSSAGAGSTTTITKGTGNMTMAVTGNFTVDGNPAGAIQADFNAMESLNVDSNGNVYARPTLYAVPTALAGKADGTVVNQNGTPVVGAVVVLEDSSGNVQNTYATDSSGNFDLHSVTAGTYQIYVYNNYTTASGQALTAAGNTNSSASFAGPSVTIQAGATAQVGTIAD